MCGNPQSPRFRVVVAVLPLEAVDVSGGVGAELVLGDAADAVIFERVLLSLLPVSPYKLCVT